MTCSIETCVCGGVVSSIDFGEQMEDDNIFEEAFKSFPSLSLYLYPTPPLKKENIRSRCMCLHRKKKKKIWETDEGYHFLFWTISPAVCVCIVGTVFPSSRLVELCTRILHSQLLLLLFFHVTIVQQRIFIITISRLWRRRESDVRYEKGEKMVVGCFYLSWEGCR